MFKAYTDHDTFLKEGFFSVGEYEEGHGFLSEAKLSLKEIYLDNRMLYKGSYRGVEVSACVKHEYPDLEKIELMIYADYIIDFYDVNLVIGTEEIFTQVNNEVIPERSSFKSTKKLCKAIKKNKVFEQENSMKIDLKKVELSFVACREGAFVYNSIHNGKDISCVINKPKDKNYECKERLHDLLWQSKAKGTYVDIGGVIVLKTGCYENEFNY